MTSSIPVWGVIPAAGQGSRMQGDRPKQYLSFQGKTILEHCLDRLLSHPQIDGLVLILSEQDRHWEQLDYQSSKPVFTATGGRERLHSVCSGLELLQYRAGNSAIALVHDAVRPLVSHGDIANVIAAARDHAAGAILAHPVADTLKRQNEKMEIAATLPRAGLWRALTPQVFHLQALLNALQRVIQDGLEVTDDAQALELMGHSPLLVEGRADNIKITSPGDLELAQQIWLHQRDQNNHE